MYAWSPARSPLRYQSKRTLQLSSDSGDTMFVSIQEPYTLTIRLGYTNAYAALLSAGSAVAESSLQPPARCMGCDAGALLEDQENGTAP